MQRHELNKDWFLEFDPANPGATVKIGRSDGKFFALRFSTAKWGQGLVEETAAADGFTGGVIPVVSKIGDRWHVLVSRVERPCDNYQSKLIEGSRQSVSNDNPHLSAAGLPLKLLTGYGHCNSARIADKLRLAVAEATAEFQLPANAEWMSFADFYTQSTDMMTKAVLGQFMVEKLNLV